VKQVGQDLRPKANSAAKYFVQGQSPIFAFYFSTEKARAQQCLKFVAYRVFATVGALTETFFRKPRAFRPDSYPHVTK
jgi:hypothetical protein